MSLESTTHNIALIELAIVPAGLFFIELFKGKISGLQARAGMDAVSYYRALVVGLGMTFFISDWGNVKGALYRLGGFGP